MPDWHVLYEAAVDETNPDVFERLGFDAEDAIQHRLRELSKIPDGPLEINEISYAVDNILRLKTERLGWPDPIAPSNTAARYAHTLLFVCRNVICLFQFLVSVTRSHWKSSTPNRSISNATTAMRCGRANRKQNLVPGARIAPWCH